MTSSINLVRPLLAGLAAAGLVGAAALTQERHQFDAETLSTVHALSEAALESDLAYEITERLTTEIGPRLAGTPHEERARDWAVEMFNELGFENVRVEEFELDLWTRGHSIYEEVAITAPFPQPLYATSLGGAAACATLVTSHQNKN